MMAVVMSACAVAPNIRTASALTGCPAQNIDEVAKQIDQISAYKETIALAHRDAEAFAFRGLQKLGPTITDEDRRKFITRRDQLVQLLYQGDDRSGEAQALLNRALYNYEMWRTN